MNSICKICGNEHNNETYLVKERILNKGDIFEYLKCSKCGTLMLNEDIDDIGEWYPSDYNPFMKKTNKSLLLTIKNLIITEVLIRLDNEKLFQKVLNMKKIDILIKRLYGTKISRRMKILDVGCGNGHWLDALYAMGYKNITGVDLFFPGNKETKWKFIKGEIFDIKEKFDLVTLHHSFEHMYNPDKVLRHIRKLMSKKGKCIISVPLVDGVSWNRWKEDFCQIDAPRHIYLYTEKSMVELCEKAGLSVERVLYDSHGKILSMSSAFKRTNKKHKDLMNFDGATQKQMEEFNRIARESNLSHTGDQAIFYIKKRIERITSLN